MVDTLLADLSGHMPSQAGKVFVITGTTGGGLGHVLAREAARKGAVVVCVNKPPAREFAGLATLREAVPDGVFDTVECDLASFASVRTAAAQITDKYPAIDVLANNAGIAAYDDTKSEDGLDMIIQVNYMSHFLLTSLLFPCLERAAEAKGEARIVNHSSVTRWHKILSKKHFLRGHTIDETARLRYAQSKVAALIFSNALSTRLQERGSKVIALTAHPGSSSSKIIENAANDTWSYLYKFMFTNMFYYSSQSVEAGACPIVKCCMDGNVKSGGLYGPKRYEYWGEAVLIDQTKEEQSLDTMDRLWQASEESVGKSFFQKLTDFRDGV